METCVRQSAAVIEFVTRQTSNSRPGTRKKAELFLKHEEKGEIVRSVPRKQARTAGG
jgi:hypothetical protein